MGKMMGGVLLGLILALGGYAWLERQPVEVRTEVERNILTGSKTTTVQVGEAVTGLQSLNRLVVFRTYLMALTEAEECQFWGCPIKSSQALITPAYVNYFVDMSELDGDRVTLDGNKMTIKMPRLMIERPNIDTRHQKFFNEGMWSDLTNADRRLEARTRKAARSQLYRQARQKFLVRLAKKQAIAAVYSNARRMLNASGHRDVSLTVTYKQ
ncbi:MAG: hypothetical protein CL950_01790 [Erythrobacter sp.]|nr:hypothetical protein [Erythrobacter sp.]